LLSWISELEETITLSEKSMSAQVVISENAIVDLIAVKSLSILYFQIVPGVMLSMTFLSIKIDRSLVKFKAWILFRALSIAISYE
jgi:hypothetical protein